MNMRRDLAAPGLVSSLANQPGLLSLSAVLSRRLEPSTNCRSQVQRLTSQNPYRGGQPVTDNPYWGSQQMTDAVKRCSAAVVITAAMTCNTLHVDSAQQVR